MALPSAPDLATRERVLDVLADLVARAGAQRLLRAPVTPGERTFPDRWAPTRMGVEVLLRRLAWHAELERDGVRELCVEDRRVAARVTERMPATCIEAVRVKGGAATFVLGFVGRDDVVGTVAHEVGVAFAALHRPGQADPYRSAEATEIEVDAADLERGSIATVYLGLGVLAANAAFQEYSRAGRFNGAYEPLEHDVLRAGYVPMSVVAFAMAVQAVARDGEVPAGLAGPQRDEVSAWIAALRGRRDEVRARLGIAADERCEDARTVVEPFAIDEAALRDEEDEGARRTAFRWQTNRGGIGVIAGTVFGVGFALIASRGMMPLVVIGAATGGHVVGRRVRVPRCSACASVVRRDATTCAHCGAVLRGDIERLADRLEAEEQLEADRPDDDGSTATP
jgi:hypothetical protein